MTLAVDMLCFLLLTLFGFYSVYLQPLSGVDRSLSRNLPKRNYC